MASRPIFKPPKPFWRRPVLWFVLGGVVVCLGNSGFRRLVSRWWELRRLQGELRELRTERASLEARIESSRKAGPGLERAARRELGYLKPGEVEYRFPPPAKTDQK